MKVLHVTSSYPRHDGDHVAPYLADLVAAEREAGLEVSVLAPHAAGLSPEGEVAGAPVHRFRYGPERREVLGYGAGLLTTATTPAGALVLPGYLAAMAAAVARQARRWRPDVVHAHWWLPAGMAAVVRGGRVPVVITCHGSDVHLARRPAVARVAKAVLARAAVIGTVSQVLASDLARLVPGLPSALVLRMPVVVPPEAPPALPPAPPIRLVAVGRLAVEKGFDTVISAVNRMVAGGAQVQLTIVGDGPLRRSLEGLAAASGAVSFLGAVGKTELLDAIDAAHALVVPSRREGLGLVALDAMSRGRPVIASDVGGLPETVEGGVDGLIVPPDDVEAWVQALGKVPLPAPVGRALARHNPAAVAAEHLKAYEMAVERRHA